MQRCGSTEVQQCRDVSRLVQSGEERCRELQRCSIGVEMWRCRGVERCSGSAEVNHSHRCRGAGAVKAKVQRRCRIEYMNMSKAGAEVQRGREAERQRGREEMQRCCIGIGVEMWRCRCAEVRSAGCRAGAKVQWCCGAEVQRCSIGVEI